MYLMSKIGLLLSFVFLSFSLHAQVCDGSFGDNIFDGGDFGSGAAQIVPTDPGIAPGYIYQLNPPPDDGFYNITNNTSTWGSFAEAFWINIKIIVQIPMVI